MTKLLSCLFIFVTLIFINNVRCHVRLTFPPSRTYAMDFLDLARTRGPCGFPPYPGNYSILYDKMIQLAVRKYIFARKRLFPQYINLWYCCKVAGSHFSFLCLFYRNIIHDCNGLLTFKSYCNVPVGLLMYVFGIE